MYKKSAHKVEKSLLRKKLLKIKEHIKKFIEGPFQTVYVETEVVWPGFVRPSVWKQCQKPNRSKYNRHQGYRECMRRS
jgi:hypothetical protein